MKNKFNFLWIFVIFSVLLSSCSSSVLTSGTQPEGASQNVLINYMAQPDIDYNQYYKAPDPVKGVYCSASTAGSSTRLNKLMDYAKANGINAFVIDVKDDNGYLTFRGFNKTMDDAGLSRSYISDPKALLRTLRQNGIYAIARIVTFKDNNLYKTQPDMFIKNADGTVWKDNADPPNSWLNPYNKASWDYVISMCKTAAEAGFKEIQFDYIRFSTSSLEGTDVANESTSRSDIISQFVQYAKEQLAPYNVQLSADVYGIIIYSNVDSATVGQNFAEMSKYLDYISPMIYPSHYANGTYGLDVPDMHPYDLINSAMTEANQKLDAVIPQGDHRAVIRPWLQDFTATWVHPHLSYGTNELNQQIKALNDNGITGWLLWNASNVYDGLQ